MANPPIVTSKSIMTGATTPSNTQTPLNLGPLVAKRLTTPEFWNIKPKNPMISFRWVNCANKMGESGSGPGMTDWRAAQGFVFARPEDVDGTIPPGMVRDNAIRYGDLVLMKISKREYQSALLYNHNAAVLRVAKRGIRGKGVGELTHSLDEVPGQRSHKQKIAAFIPENPFEIEQNPQSQPMDTSVDPTHGAKL